MFGVKKKPLLACEIIHHIPGRARIGCRALNYLDEQKFDIEERLANLPEVTSARVNVVTANVLVSYDATITSIDYLLDTVESVIGSYSLVAYKQERFHATKSVVDERRLAEEPISEMVTRIGIVVATLAFTWFRRGKTVPPKNFWGRFTTMPALTSLSVGAPIFKSGFESMRQNMRPNADTLSATALFTSLLAGQDISALTVILLADVAELLTAYTMKRTRSAIREMLAVGEEVVWKLQDDGTETRVLLEALQVNDRIVVRTGEKISVDGLVESGEAAVDQASITGEFLPVPKGKKEQVYAGTVVKSGRITVRAEKVGDQTAVARIVHMVEEASHKKAPIQAYADRISAGFIPVNFLLSALVFLVTKSPSRALNMLIIDYSCGVRLSTATALSAVIGNAARHGILIKGGNYIELLEEADTLILDKTGTLTEGKPQVVSVIPCNDVSQREVIENAAAAEEQSTHPLALAVMDKVRRNGWKIPVHKDTNVHVARGIETIVGRSKVRVGSRRFMEENGIDVSIAQEQISHHARRGENLVYVSKSKKLLGIIGIEDSLRENMKKSLNRLRLEGMDDIILLTGDMEQHAEVVASRMAMDSYRAELLPEDKAETVLRLQSKGVHVVMVGDGINDAPALAYSDVGIAMGGTRTDIAIEASDITIAGDNPLMIPAVIRLAKKTMGIIRQNFGISLVVNSAGLVLSSMGVLPVFWGAVLHNATTVMVVLNSGRLLVHNIEKGK
jgi:cation-transporting P-type ATPase C